MVPTRTISLLSKRSWGFPNHGYFKPDVANALSTSSTNRKRFTVESKSIGTELAKMDGCQINER
jgi:hypothetical protein